MEILFIPLFIIVHFLATIFLIRMFFKQLSVKLESITSLQTQSQSPFPFPSAFPQVVVQKPDKPSPNVIDEDDPNIVDFNENSPIIPKDIKIEVEGGDSFVPPGFAIK